MALNIVTESKKKHQGHLSDRNSINADGWLNGTVNQLYLESVRNLFPVGQVKAPTVPLKQSQRFQLHTEWKSDTKEAVSHLHRSQTSVCMLRINCGGVVWEIQVCAVSSFTCTRFK